MRRHAPLAAMLVLCATTATAAPADPQSRVADGAADWLSYNHGPSEQRFSPLRAITAENVGRLKLAWYADLPTARGQEATPLAIDGVLYTTTAWSIAEAHDGATGKLLWRFDPAVARAHAAYACCDSVNRGMAFLDGRLFLGTLDGRLVALDAATGKKIWSVQTTDPKGAFSITGAPRIAAGRVVIGNGGGEFGVRGYISAYEPADGKLAWRFYTVPANPKAGPDHAASDPVMARAAGTWSGTWWKLGGGGTVWDAIAYDPERNLVFFGTGNGTPWNHKVAAPGGGDELFLASILALDAKTGAYRWHYQTTAGETWDFDATQQLVQADLKIGGTTRPVLMQANKNGFFYVLDRETGKPLSAGKFVTVTWARGVDMRTGRPEENAAARYGETGKPALVSPSAYGAHSWQPMAFSPRTGLAYIPAQEIPTEYIGTTSFHPSSRGFNVALDWGKMAAPLPADAVKAAWDSLKGALVAWDPVRQRQAWRVDYAGPWNSGVLATAGNLVFQGTAGGQFHAYAADSGKALWSAPAGTGVVAGPMTYQAGGRQFIAVMAGWGGAYPLAAGPFAYKSGRVENVSRLLAFSLDGTAALPAAPPPDEAVLNPPPLGHVSPAVIELGRGTYERFCGQCHGTTAVSGSPIPDLRHSATLADAATFHDVVIGGALAQNGMAGFAGALDEAQVDAVRAYLIARANEDKTAAPAAKPVR